MVASSNADQRGDLRAALGIRRRLAIFSQNPGVFIVLTPVASAVRSDRKLL